MSSHHVVRENQEPALLVQDFHALDAEYLGQILEWSPTIVTDRSNVDFFLAEGIKVDILITSDTNVFEQEQTKVILAQRSLIEDGIAYLIGHQYKAVNLFCSSVDESLSTYAPLINIVVFCKGIRYVFVQNRYEKWKAAGDFVYLSESNIKSIQGLTYVSAGVFKTEQDGFFKLEFNTNEFVIIGEDI